MTSEQYIYWLRGFTELVGTIPTERQWESIKRHLDSCFVKDPAIHGTQIDINSLFLKEKERVLPDKDHTYCYRPELKCAGPENAPGPQQTC